MPAHTPPSEQEYAIPASQARKLGLRILELILVHYCKAWIVLELHG